MILLHLSSLLVILTLQNAVQGFNNFAEFREEKTAREKQAYFTKTFLKLYTGFSLMFHVENSTIYNINYLLKIVHCETFGEIIIMNQDTLPPINFQQRKGSPFLHLVVLNHPKKFEAFLESPGCLISSDVVTFILIENNKTLEDNFWSMRRLSWAGNVVILSIFNRTVSLYNVCYYCGKFTRKLHHLQTNSYNKIQVNKSDILPRNFRNFNGHRFRVGYFDNFPYMWCESAEDTKKNAEVFRTCTRASGLEIGILGVLSKKLNFAHWLIEYGDSLDGSEEDINKEGSGKLDFIIGGLSITVARAPKMSFTSATAFEPCTFLYIPRKSKFSELLDGLKPFHKYLWITVCFSLFMFSSALYISTKLLSNSASKPPVSFSKSFKICFKSIIEQSERVCTNMPKVHFSPYMVLVLWWCASMIIATAYRSKLWAISIKNYHVEPSNLQELLDNNYGIVVSSDNMDIITDMFTETEPMLVEAKKRLVTKNRTCDTLSYALNNKAAMLDEHATLQYHVLVRCSKVLTKDVYSQLRITKTPLRQTTHSWPLQMGAPYKYAFNTLIGRIESAGLQIKWKSDSLSVLRNKYDTIPFSQTGTMEKEEKKKFLQGFTSSFCFYILGNFVALLFFIAEITYAKYSKKKK